MSGVTCEQWPGLKNPPFRPRVHIKVRSSEKAETHYETDRAEYFYPHEIPDLNVQSLKDITRALDAITADPATKFMKLAPEHKRLVCIYELWTRKNC